MSGREGRPRWDDIDEVAVRLACQGVRVDLNAGELRAAIAVLTRHGMSHRAIAEHLGVSARTVNRHHAAIRDTPPEENAA